MEETKDDHTMTEHVTLIVAGGELSLPFFEQQLQQYPKHTLIAADRGLEYCMSVGREPDYVIGDFDSLDEKVREAFIAKETNVKKLNPIKDDTDTEAALQWAFAHTKGDIYILGGIGSRMDHVLGNLALLGQGFAHGREIFLLDPHNRIRMVNHQCTIKKDEQYGQYVSVISFCGEAKGVSEQGVFYPLNQASLPPFTSLGISNEIVDEEAVISVEQGVLLVVESKD